MNKETRIPIGRIGEYLGCEVPLPTAHRWRLKGISHQGQRIRLPAIKIGSRFYVTESGLAEFIDKLNDSSETISDRQSTATDTMAADSILDGMEV